MWSLVYIYIIIIIITIDLFLYVSITKCENYSKNWPLIEMKNNLFNPQHLIKNIKLVQGNNLTSYFQLGLAWS
jgi:hypothetical protein